MPNGPPDEDESRDRVKTSSKEKTLDDKLNRLLQDLGKALSELIAESPDVTDTLDEIHREGYRLSLLVDCSPDSDDVDELEVSEEFESGVVGEFEVAEVEFVAQNEDGETADETPTRRRIEPMFQINSGDLAFFRSIGIDPTQKLKKRRSN